MAAMRLASVALGVVAVAAQQPAEAPVTLRLYDCNVEYDVWETNWTPEWKDWCCKNRQRGCPSTSTTTETSTTVTTTTRTTTKVITTTEDPKVAVERCNEQCVFAGSTATCAARVQWVAKFGGSKDEAKPCDAAHSLILSQCDVCSKCELKFSGCSSPQAQEEEKDEKEEKTDKKEKKKDEKQTEHHSSVGSQQPQEDKERPSKRNHEYEMQQAEHCNKQCVLADTTATCTARMQFTAMYGDAKDTQEPCSEAHAEVLSQCDVCNKCSLKFSGCSVDPREAQELETKEKHVKHDATLHFRKKFEFFAATGSQASGAQGLLPGFVVAGFAAGALLLAVLQRGMRRPSRQVELSDQIYTAADEQGE
mmetsp:Transcript_88571/g.286068  ORF Transcript_88571/g.286068 Transcript_88571/m.286068 type:complete len:364 (+) Transcript_88571:56-1147(+)